MIAFDRKADSFATAFGVDAGRINSLMSEYDGVGVFETVATFITREDISIEEKCVMLIETGSQFGQSILLRRLHESNKKDRETIH